MNILNRTIAGALFAAVSATGAWADSADPIKIPINEWTGQHISAHITGSLLQKAGYNIEYVTRRRRAAVRGDRPGRSACPARDLDQQRRRHLPQGGGERRHRRARLARPQAPRKAGSIRPT